VKIKNIASFTYVCDNEKTDTRPAELYAWTFNSNWQKLSIAYNGYKVSPSLDRNTVFSTKCGVSLLASSLGYNWMDVYTFNTPGDYYVVVDHMRMFQQQSNCPSIACRACPNHYDSSTHPCGEEAPGWVNVAVYQIRVASNNAEYVSQSVPNPMCAGKSYTVSVTMKNTGVTTWTTGGNYRLGSQNPQDNTIWGIGRVGLASGESIAPGQSKTFTFTVTAPSNPSTYNFQWRMVQDGVEWFGATTPNVAVNVIDCTTTTISGRVTRNTGSGISGVGIELCGGLSATTDSNGYWSKSVSPGTSFCVRASSGIPAGYTSIAGIRNNACHTNNPTYEWQVAGQNAYQDCSYTDQRSWDLNMDTGLDIVVYYPTTTTTRIATTTTRPTTTTTRIATTTTRPTTTTSRPIASTTSTTTATTTTTAPHLSKHVVLAYRVEDDMGVAACSMWNNFSGGWGLKRTETAINNGGINYFDLGMVPQGVYKWAVNCSDTGGHNIFPSNAPKGYWIFSVG